ncbi:MAG TPA: signal peptidase I [Acidimicrobiales bacterium]|jgi:signal peptidase|nr:signal peptidase I [Acidimicrobiales bacterium]
MTAALGDPMAAGHPIRAARETVSTAGGFAVAFVAVLVVFLAVSLRTSGQKGQAAILSHPVMSVLSGSMAPTIKTGDLVVDDRLSSVQADHLRPGQIISFRAPTGGQIFTHRIVAVQRLAGGAVGYVTKGDANDARDGPVVPSTAVVGLFQSRIPAGGYLLNDLHRPLVLGLLLVSPLLWLVAQPLWHWAREPDEAESLSFSDNQQKGLPK